MGNSIELSVAICTRNRHKDLMKCVESISRQTNMEEDSIEVIIVDDGDTDRDWLDHAGSLINKGNMYLRYYKKDPSEAGLIKSRVKSIEISSYETILFIDDDVELSANYLDVLKQTLISYPEAVGISGADQGLSCSLKGRFMMILSGRSLFSPGKYSLSGFASAMNLWNIQKNVFRTEFLHGCNMCYRKQYLSEIEAVSWLQGYSLGEDLYISALAGKHGPMYVNPDLKLIHHGSPTSRDNAEQVAHTKIINHFHLLKTRNKANYFRYFMLRWTAGFLSLEAKFNRNHEAYLGYKKGKEELRSLFKGA
ncbi:glycosyltransferase family A protein [Paenibacillus sp. NPDC057934]|uniref:glycosyltransferase family A protein n=1 Tax=Paenibacillus sp. NPDC057934 TaxID=3346282 RepID=UPI0036D7A4D0